MPQTPGHRLPHVHRTAPAVRQCRQARPLSARDPSGPCPVQPPSTPIATAGLAGRAAARIGTARPCPLGIVAADANRLLPRPPNDRPGADGRDAVIPKWRIVGCDALGIASYRHV